MVGRRNALQEQLVEELEEKFKARKKPKIFSEHQSYGTSPLLTDPKYVGSEVNDAVQIAYPLYECYTSEVKYNDKLHLLRNTLAQDLGHPACAQLGNLKEITKVSNTYLSDLRMTFQDKDLKNYIGTQSQDRGQLIDAEDSMELIINDLMCAMKTFDTLSHHIQINRDNFLNYIIAYEKLASQGVSGLDLLSEPFQRLMRYPMTLMEVRKRLHKALGDSSIVVQNFQDVCHKIEKQIDIINLMKPLSVVSAQECHVRTMEKLFEKIRASIDPNCYDMTMVPKKRGQLRPIIIELKEKDLVMAIFKIEKCKDKKGAFKRKGISYSIRLTHVADQLELSVLKRSMDELKQIITQQVSKTSDKRKSQGLK